VFNDRGLGNERAFQKELYGGRLFGVDYGDVDFAALARVFGAFGERVEEAYPGDILGLHNHGTIAIGDTFTEGEVLGFTGIPHFAPELFRRAVLRDPLRLKALQKGLTQLCEEGATQFFRPLRSNDLIAIGPALITFRHSNQQPHDSDANAFILSTLFLNRVRIQQIAILVADMRGFTPLTESIPIHTLSKIMSEWFHNVSTNIQAGGGAVEKFIGDCVYARWDITGHPEDAVLKALRSALAVQHITQELNVLYPDLPQKLRIGAGINIGDAAVGVGQENAAIGDAVNTAFRLESASKELGCDIVIGCDAYALLPRALWEGREHTISAKGKRDTLRVCGLHFADVERMSSS
ncbi:MAG: hypothetical protein HY273_16470, partial [Gammaproteobacteria bacterium]|nr:hypothetical protein [Gammaproteobacteria bacterium]